MFNFDFLSFLPYSRKDVNIQISRMQHMLAVEDLKDLDSDEVSWFWYYNNFKRLKIENFLQAEDENLFQAWRRFKELLSQFSHHQILIHFFCKGAHAQFQEHLRGLGHKRAWEYLDSLTDQEPSIEQHVEEEVCLDLREFTVDVPWPSWKEDVHLLIEEQEAKA